MQYIQKSGEWSLMDKKSVILKITFLGLLLFQTRSLNTLPIDSFFGDGNLWWFGNIAQFFSLIEDPFAPFPDTIKAGYKSGLIAFGSGSNQPWNLILKTLARWGKWCGDSSYLIYVFPGLLAYFMGGWLLFVRMLDKLCFPARGIGFLVYILLPMGVSISRSIIPEVYAIPLLAIQLYFFNYYLKTQRKINLAFFVISFCISTYFFPKNAIIMICMSFFAAFYEKLYKKKTYLIWVTSLLFLWCCICKYIYTKNNWTAGHSEQILVKDILSSHAFWQGWLNIVKTWYNGIFVVVPLAILINSKRPLVQINLLGLLFGYFVLGLYFSYHTYTHAYYSSALILVLSLSWAAVVDSTLCALNRSANRKKYQPVVTCAFLFVILWLYGNEYFRIVNEKNKLAEKTKTIQTRYRKIDEITNKSKKIIFFTEASGTYFQTFSLSDGWGWPNDNNYFGEKAVGKWIGVSKDGYYKYLFDEFVRNNAEYFATDLFDEFKKQGKIYNEIQNNYPLIYAQDNVMVYDLRKQSLRPHGEKINRE